MEKNIKDRYYFLHHRHFRLSIDLGIPMFKGRYHGYLGNLTEGGWFWEFSDYQLIVAMLHITKSRISDDFCDKFNEHNIPLDIFVNDLKKSLNEDVVLRNIFIFINGWSNNHILDYARELISDIEETNPAKSIKIEKLITNNYMELEKEVFLKIKPYISKYLKTALINIYDIREVIDNLNEAINQCQNELLEITNEVLQEYY